MSSNPNDSDFLHTSDNYGEQTETRASSRHPEITLQAANIVQDDVYLNTDEGSFVATSKTSTDTGSFSPETHSFKVSDSPGYPMTGSHSDISPGSGAVADSEDFNNAIAAKGINRISTFHSRIIPKQLFLSAGDAGESVSWHEYESSKGPTGSIHVRKGNFSESSLRNLEATSHKPITHSGVIVANPSVGEIANCSSSSSSQHKTEYLSEDKMPPSRSASNLVGNYESPAGHLPGAAFNVVQASDDMTKGNVLGRSVFSKHAANTKDDPHVSIKYPEDIVAPNTSLVKDRPRNYCSHREKESLTESEIPAFQSASNLTDNLEVPIRNSVDEALDVVRTSAYQTIRNILERFEFSEYAANRGNDIDNTFFANEACNLLMTLPENTAYECKDFVLQFLEQAYVPVKYPQNVIPSTSQHEVMDHSSNFRSLYVTESPPGSNASSVQTTSNLTGNQGTPIRNLVDEALFVVQTSAHLTLTSILRRIRFSGYAAGREIEIDEFAFDNETRRLLMRLPENIAHECKGFILYFLHQALNTVLVG
ncbi:hypothetical protein AVEN_168193-1 [Araneus ventricosus]|uniref:Uncharacterized protein n=1 Tax=Araneus ventricosus TaxID=182803 RepID=A0A4Y2QGW0_ARAVE|nr:hypothetical protein AVEN_168193-1 [Araneus ventricosus]